VAVIIVYFILLNTQIMLINVCMARFAMP